LFSFNQNQHPLLLHLLKTDLNRFILPFSPLFSLLSSLLFMPPFSLHLDFLLAFFLRQLLLLTLLHMHLHQQHYRHPRKVLVYMRIELYHSLCSLVFQQASSTLPTLPVILLYLQELIIFIMLFSISML